uniref:Uncharacterized protein n=1 Tax=Pararge aegeria TaxID=116150 RepID=S4PMN3_9NEOP
MCCNYSFNFNVCRLQRLYFPCKIRLPSNNHLSLFQEQVNEESRSSQPFILVEKFLVTSRRIVAIAIIASNRLSPSNKLYK